MSKIRTIDIEVAIMREYGVRQNLIVPNVTNMTFLVPFEVDMLVLSKSGYATGFEIKISKSDLKADLKKRHIYITGNGGLGNYYGRFKYFYYAVPIELTECALQQIRPEFGLYAYDKSRFRRKILKVREAKVISCYKWNDKQRYELARLGAMRILGLKESIITLNKVICATV